MCRQLVAAWVAVVQDYAVLGTHGPLVQAAYTPRLFPVPSLSIIARLLPKLHTCWPAALRALAATLPQAAGKPTLASHTSLLHESPTDFTIPCGMHNYDAWNTNRLYCTLWHIQLYCGTLTDFTMS